eukprot:SAG31_NODE_30_length_32545_cov_9.378999_8_plen_85_part_00
MLLNRGAKTANITVYWKDLDLPGAPYYRANCMHTSPCLDASYISVSVIVLLWLPSFSFANSCRKCHRRMDWGDNSGGRRLSSTR